MMKQRTWAAQICLTWAGCVLPVLLSAQTSPGAAPARKVPAFDVSTVRANTSASGNSGTQTHGGAFTAENTKLRMLLVQAFAIREQLIFGLPPWAESNRYDLEAKVVDPDKAAMEKLTGDERRRMLQILLEDRFQLKWHFETRVLPAYELVLAKDGSKLKPDPSPVGIGSSSGDTMLKGTGVPLAALTDGLSQTLGRPVVDKTGLEGTFDYDLKWAREAGADAAASGAPDDAPPLLTAIQEQLGLRLQSGKDPVQVLVIDSLSQPTAN